MDQIKTKAKLKTLTRTDLNLLYKMVQDEIEERGFHYQSNTTHTPNEQCQSLATFLANAREQHC
jgi:hypothetical protein